MSVAPVAPPVSAPVRLVSKATLSGIAVVGVLVLDKLNPTFLATEASFSLRNHEIQTGRGNIT
ncbi:hypothetical protein AB6E88_14465 [Providencia hangzhouensis]